MATSMKGVLILDKRKKKLIAKEIIYFFKSIFLLLLIWVGIEIRNIYLLKKNEAYKKEILTVSLELDSLQKIISNSSKKISFDELIGNYSDSITNSNSLRKVSTKKDVAENTLPLPPDEPDVPGTIALQKKPTQSVSSTSTFVPPSDGEALKEEDANFFGSKTSD